MTNQSYDVRERWAAADLIVLPGIGDSGREHWQSRWQERNPSMRRLQCADWDRPNLENWISALDRELAASKAPPLLVAHSLGCLLVAHWASTKSTAHVAGAFLVAVPDPNSAAFPAEARSFANPPATRLPFPSLVVASTDDPYGSLGDTEIRAKHWGSGIVVAGALGHINDKSGIGDWPQGLALLRAFAAGALPHG